MFFIVKNVFFITDIIIDILSHAASPRCEVLTNFDRNTSDINYRLDLLCFIFLFLIRTESL